jgi:hypothetical protein
MEHFARLDIVEPGPAQRGRVQEDIAIDILTGHETIAAQRVEPFDDGGMERRIDDGMGMKAPRPYLGLVISAGHFQDFDRLATLLTFHGVTDNQCIGQCRPMAITAQATGMEKNVTRSIAGIDEAVASSRIIPFDPPLEADKFRFFKNVVRKNHHITRFNNST